MAEAVKKGQPFSSMSCDLLLAAYVEAREALKKLFLINMSHKCAESFGLMDKAQKAAIAEWAQKCGGQPGGYQQAIDYLSGLCNCAPGDLACLGTCLVSYGDGFGGGEKLAKCLPKGIGKALPFCKSLAGLGWNSLTQNTVVVSNAIIKALFLKPHGQVDAPAGSANWWYHRMRQALAWAVLHSACSWPYELFIVMGTAKTTDFVDLLPIPLGEFTNKGGIPGGCMIASAGPIVPGKGFSLVCLCDWAAVEVTTGNGLPDCLQKLQPYLLQTGCAYP